MNFPKKKGNFMFSKIEKAAMKACKEGKSLKDNPYREENEIHKAVIWENSFKEYSDFLLEEEIFALVDNMG